jgi:hypothetical protein
MSVCSGAWTCGAEGSSMKRFLGICATLTLSGCVIGQGPCRLLEPISTTLSGTIHFRDYPSGGGVDNVPVLALDNTANVYSPAESQTCMPVNDIQLVGWSEFPPDIIEGARIRVHGSLFAAASSHQHTRFLMNVATVTPLRAAPH